MLKWRIEVRCGDSPVMLTVVEAGRDVDALEMALHRLHPGVEYTSITVNRFILVECATAHGLSVYDGEERRMEQYPMVFAYGRWMPLTGPMERW